MSATVRKFLDVARCEDVDTSSNPGRVVTLHPRRRKRPGTLDAEVHIRTTDDERGKWKAEAAALDVTLSDLIRSKMNGSVLKVAQVTEPALFNELRRQGINLNQLLHAVHAGLPVDRERVSAALDALRAVYMRLLREFV